MFYALCLILVYSDLSESQAFISVVSELTFRRFITFNQFIEKSPELIEKENQLAKTNEVISLLQVSYSQAHSDFAQAMPLSVAEQMLKSGSVTQGQFDEYGNSYSSLQMMDQMYADQLSALKNDQSKILREIQSMKK